MLKTKTPLLHHQHQHHRHNPNLHSLHFSATLMPISNRTLHCINRENFAIHFLSPPHKPPLRSFLLKKSTRTSPYSADDPLHLVQISKGQNSIHEASEGDRLDILGQLGGTPNFMLSPPNPKEHLVEKYFDPDNMSASDKMELELQKVRNEFKMSGSDCGSARVQVAQLTVKINYLSTVLHKKDKHTLKGLKAMVQMRKKLLKYLRRTDLDSYRLVVSKLGIRDNPDFTNSKYPKKRHSV